MPLLQMLCLGETYTYTRMKSMKEALHTKLIRPQIKMTLEMQVDLDISKEKSRVAEITP